VNIAAGLPTSRCINQLGPLAHFIKANNIWFAMRSAYKSVTCCLARGFNDIESSKNTSAKPLVNTMKGLYNLFIYLQYNLYVITSNIFIFMQPG
jgi:hypothetical protein